MFSASWKLLAAPTVLLATSVISESCLPANPPSSIAATLENFSNSANQCQNSAKNVLIDSISNLINEKDRQIAELTAAKLLEKERMVDFLNKHLIGDLELTNPRFSNGKYYNYGSYNLSPSAAIDGVISGGSSRSNFAHSSNDKEKIFMVDVNSNAGAHISAITIYPRQDCCWERYTNMEVFLQNVDGSIAPSECDSISDLDAKSVRSGKASGLKWKCPFLDNVKSILVKNPDNVHIQIAEIAASGFMLPPLEPEITQLTLSNPRFSDNTYYKNGRYNLAPKSAIDGKWIGQSPTSGFAHSSKSKKFLVDLPGNSVTVKQITIYPRQDCCYERYSKITVKVDDVTCTTEQDLSSKSVSSAKKTGLVFTCENAIGHEIIVENPANVHLQIAEIVAMGF